MKSSADGRRAEAEAQPWRAIKRTVAELRAGLTKEERDLLNAVWRPRMEEGRWPESVAVRLALEGMDARQVAERLGGSIIQEHPAAGSDPITYRLTTLGMFLTDEGSRLEDFLRHYVEHVRDKLRRDRKLSDTQFKEIRESLGFGDRQLAELRIMLFEDWGYLWNTGGSNGADGYTTKSPRFEELLRVDDVGAWIENAVSARHVPNEPVDVQRRELRSSVRATEVETPRFAFITDTALRSLLESDSGELERAYGVGAWKACVILAGAIVEGMLLDAVLQDSRAVEAVVKRCKTREPTTWKLDDLVRIARDLGIIRSSSAALSDVVRVFRNVVHPARQVAENMPATKVLADSARSTVELLRVELAGRAKQSA